MSDQALVHAIRDQIRREGPISFARFMAQALYHPVHGYYSSGRCVIGRRGDYFTSVSVGSLFGNLMAAQFAEIWETLDRPGDFVIVEQGAHHGEFASDVLEALRTAQPDLYAVVRCRIVEPFPILRQRQQDMLRQYPRKTEWVTSLEEMEPFCGVHFSNELLDAMPVHLLVSVPEGSAFGWQERRVDGTSRGFTFVARPISDPRLLAQLATIPKPPAAGYERGVNLAALDWVELLAKKLERGVVLIADYGFTRRDFYAAERCTGTLRSYAGHHLLQSPLEQVGESDLTAHVEWTSLAERAEASGLTIVGFADQHHFLTGLLASNRELAAAAAKKGPVLQTLLHPELLGTKFQFLGLAKGFPKVASLGGLQFARRMP